MSVKLTWHCNVHKNLFTSYDCSSQYRVYTKGSFNFLSWSTTLSASRGISIRTDGPPISFSLDEYLNLKSSEFVITPIELKPMRAPAIDGVSIVPVTGNNAPAAIGIPNCKRREEKANKLVVG